MKLILSSFYILPSQCNPCIQKWPAWYPDKGQKIILLLYFLSGYEWNGPYEIPYVSSINLRWANPIHSRRCETRDTGSVTVQSIQNTLTERQICYSITHHTPLQIWAQVCCRWEKEGLGTACSVLKNWWPPIISEPPFLCTIGFQRFKSCFSPDGNRQSINGMKWAKLRF